MKVFATICSREKDHHAGLLPAKDRYVGEHIKAVRTEADAAHSPLYILSGKYGLISGDDPIPDYDYLLEQEDAGLKELVARQVSEAGITEIDFYSKDKDSWAPYAETLRKACDLAGITLRTHAA